MILLRRFAWALCALGLLTMLGLGIRLQYRSLAAVDRLADRIEQLEQRAREDSRVGLPHASAQRAGCDIDYERLGSLLASQVSRGAHERAAEDGNRTTEERQPKTDAQARAVEEGLAVVEHALEEGVWLEEDATTLRLTLGRTAPEDQPAVIAELFSAINDGRLRLLAQRPL